MRTPERHRQKVEIGIPQLAPPLEQPHSNEEESIGKKRTTRPGHGARILYRRRNEQIRLTIRQAAHLKCRLQQEDFKKEIGIKGGGPRYLALPLENGPCRTAYQPAMRRRRNLRP
jgi:hypothetical protein